MSHVCRPLSADEDVSNARDKHLHTAVTLVVAVVTIVTPFKVAIIITMRVAAVAVFAVIIIVEVTAAAMVAVAVSAMSVVVIVIPGGGGCGGESQRRSHCKGGEQKFHWDYWERRFLFPAALLRCCSHILRRRSPCLIQAPSLFFWRHVSSPVI